MGSKKQFAYFTMMILELDGPNGLVNTIVQNVENIPSIHMLIDASYNYANIVQRILE